MIKIVESGQGVRLMYDEVEVLNHTTVMPFAKSLKCHTHYFKKGGVVSGYIDTEGEYALTDYKVKSVSVHSANISFLGYDGTTLDISVVEEKDKLTLHLKPSVQSIKLQFITGPLYTIKKDGEELNNKLASNIKKTTLPFFKVVKKQDVQFESKNTITFMDKTLEISSKNLTEYDFTKKASGAISFVECPKEIIVRKTL